MGPDQDTVVYGARFMLCYSSRLFFRVMSGVCTLDEKCLLGSFLSTEN